jgi:subtilisin-like proprotein convertase family protein
MKRLNLLFALLLGVCTSTAMLAQYNLTSEELRNLPTITLPAQDNLALLTAELEARKPGRAQTFAVALPVTVRPSTHGSWTQEGAISTWRTRILSQGAKTLNLGFSEYNLPEGAALYLISPEQKYGPFTVSDNEDHNQFWSPLLEGEELIIELTVPTALKKRIQLYLTAVNHDFKGVTKVLSGSCNLDVACSGEDGWGIVDSYRDIIRSVAAYTINGTDVCTGFLVNNVNQDGTPFFMTANHCNVTAESGPALVAYWNFESPECREPGSAASGQTGFGNRNTFNSGTRHLASWADSDVTITQLDDPVVPEANAFFAGWDANFALPSDTVVGIHHPSVDEKRISFSFNQTYRTNNGGGAPNVNGNLLEVPDWSIGTTESGSSGSPIFDVTGHVRGQLFGGQAACGNDEYDVYGYFPVSWEGGGTPATRLKDWLDPCGTGVLKIEGFDQAQLPLLLTAETNCTTACISGVASFQINVGEGHPAGSQVSISSFSPGLMPSISVSEAVGGQEFDLIVPGEGLAAGLYEVVVSITSDAGTDDITLIVDFAGSLAEAPAELAPANNETEVNPLITFEWGPVDEAVSYDVQLSSVGDFSFLTYIGNGLTGTTLAIGQAMEPNTTYSWRVRTNNTCGAGDWAVYQFTTDNLGCGVAGATDTPIVISSNGTPEVTSVVASTVMATISSMEVSLVIDHTYVGDLDADLVSPDGTMIRLFNPVRGGSCSRSNMVVTFSDAAVRTHDDFVDACTGDPATRGTFQPAEALSAFSGESAEGEWTLTLRDGANFDGGNIINFAISFCGEGSIGDFSTQIGASEIVACVSSATTIDLMLGNDFTNELSLEIRANGRLIDNFSTNFDDSENLLTVNFSNWDIMLPAGTHTLAFEVILPSGDSRTVSIPLYLSVAAEAATLSSPANEEELVEGPVEFVWAGATGANGYRFEYSMTADFSTVDFSLEEDGTSLIRTSLPSGTIYWRVVSLSECDEVISAVNELTITPNGIQDFGQGRTISVYPNPVKGMLTVETEGNWSGIVSAGLFDASGRFVASYQMNGAGREAWNLGGLAAGVYYLRFSGAGRQLTERLIVLP